MKKLAFVGLIVSLGFLLLAPAGVQAGVLTGNFSGTLWTDVTFDYVHPLPYFVDGTGDATFKVNALDFNSYRSGSQTYNGFLNNGATGSNGLVWESGESLKDSFVTGGDYKGTLFLFTGSMYLESGYKLTISHDDGFYLKLGGIIYDYSDPTAEVPTVITWTGATGSIDFELYYSACNGFPEVLTVNVVPEPCTMLLIGSGLMGLAACRKRFKR